MNKNKNNRLLKDEKGISLIVLVITIVVIFILAGVSTSMMLSEEGILKQSQEVQNAQQDFAQSEANKVDALINQVDSELNGYPTIQDVMKRKVASVNVTAVDSYGNKIVIPAGFKIVAHTGKELSDVTYTYHTEDGLSTNIPVVQDGIVIENVEDENQFVWIPIGNIKNKDGSTTTITLGRYSDFKIKEDGTLPTPAQVASKTDYDIPTPIANYNVEISSDFMGGTFNGTTYEGANEYKDSSGNTNIKAYNLQEWITTTLANGGYYIARYEASKNGEKAVSKISTRTPATSNSITISDGMLWNWITQPEAALAARQTYSDSMNSRYYSDLMNSYAWETAIIFIAKYSGNTTYAGKKGTDINTSLTNTGVNNDKVCNIHDMAGNVVEWTTETYVNSSGFPCIARGGYYGDSNYYTAIRYAGSTTIRAATIAFRIALNVI